MHERGIKRRLLTLCLGDEKVINLSSVTAFDSASDFLFIFIFISPHSQIATVLSQLIAVNTHSTT